jgi:N-acetylmuramoyl-L-alanine amidase
MLAVNGRMRLFGELGLFALMAIGLLLLFALTGRRGDHRPLEEALAEVDAAALLDARTSPDDGHVADASLPASAGTTGAPAPAATGTSAAASASPTSSADAARIGIIAGHWQYDTGAVCPDGLEEVQVTQDVAQRVAAILDFRGLVAEVLPEHDPDLPGPPLQNYRAALLVAIHADSCDIPGASGFKVARWRYSEMPETDDRLVECLQARYAASTLLARHDDSITIDMWNYYAFREIAVETPAAIIELGFLLDDRSALENLRYEMALGIADGIACFLEPAGGA